MNDKLMEKLGVEKEKPATIGEGFSTDDFLYIIDNDELKPMSVTMGESQNKIYTWADGFEMSDNFVLSCGGNSTIGCLQVSDTFEETVDTEVIREKMLDCPDSVNCSESDFLTAISNLYARIEKEEGIVAYVAMSAHTWANMRVKCRCAVDIYTDHSKLKKINFGNLWGAEIYIFKELAEGEMIVSNSDLTVMNKGFFKLPS